MDMSARKRLADFLITLRGDRSQRSLARSLNVSFASIRSWEECQSVPNLNNMRKIANYSNQSFEDLMLYLEGTGDNQANRQQLINFQTADDLLPFIKQLPKRELILLTDKLLKLSSWNDRDVYTLVFDLTKSHHFSVPEIQKLVGLLMTKLDDDR